MAALPEPAEGARETPEECFDNEYDNETHVPWRRTQRTQEQEGEEVEQDPNAPIQHHASGSCTGIAPTDLPNEADQSQDQDGCAPPTIEYFRVPETLRDRQFAQYIGADDEA